MPMNASTSFSKKCVDIQIKLEKVKSTKPIDAINAYKDHCKMGHKEIQQIEPSFNLTQSIQEIRTRPSLMQSMPSLKTLPTLRFFQE
jgi:hypothetical protein